MCNLCEKNFSSISNLDRHKRTIHKVDDEYENNVDEDQDEYDDDMGSAVEEDENDIEDTESDTESTEDSSDDDDEVDVWATIDKNADGLEGDELKEQLMESMKTYINLCRSLKKDSTARAILKALKRAQDDDEMKYSEALDHAIDRRKFLLLKTYTKWKANQQEENE